MINLYDIEVNKEVLATLSYLLIEAGADIKNKYELDTILYKFYNFIKDDINFDDGVLVTPELKSKIIEFAQIIDTLPNSPITDEYKFAFDIKGKDTSSDCVFEEDYVVVDVNDVHMANGVIINKGTAAFYPVFYLETNRISDNYKGSSRIATKSFTEDFAYAKVGFKYYSASYVYVVVELYSEDGELITEYSKSASLKPADYGIRIKYVYDNSTVANIYSHYNHFIYDYSVDETTFDKLDVDLLEDGAIYKATDFIANTYRNQFINIHNIANKSIDGVNMDHPYQQLVKMLRREECYGDKLLFKYLTVFKQREGDTQYGIISTKPFYYTGDTTATSNDPALANISNTVSNLNMYFRYFKSNDNGKTWVLQTGTVGSSTNSHTASGKYNTMDYRYPIYFNGYDVVYNSYPIFYGVKAIKIIRKEDIDNFSDSKRLKVWRNSDDEFTLHDLPAGGVFYYGKYRVEGSFLSPLTFAVTSFADSLDRVCAISTHKIEYMCYTTKTSSSSPREKGYSPQAELYQWLNSTRKGYSWWTSYYDGDLPPTEENCLADSYGYYAHKDGFLSNFTKAEMSIMEDRQLNFGQYVGSDKPDNIAKVHLPSVSELGCVSSPTHTLGRAKYMYTQAAGLHHNLKYHKKRFDESLFEGGDNIGGPVDSKYPVFVRYNNQGKIGVITGNTTSTTFVERNTAYCVQPFMVLQDAKISREPDEHGIFSLIFDEEEDTTVFIEKDFELLRDVKAEVDINTELIRKTEVDVLDDYQLIRKVGVEYGKYYPTCRHIREDRILDLSMERNLLADVVIDFKTKRACNFIYTYKFPLCRKPVEDLTKDYPLQRKLHENIDTETVFGLERKILNDDKKDYPLYRQVLGNIAQDYLLCRNILEDITDLDFPTERKVTDGREFYFAIERKLQSDLIKDFGLKRRLTIPFEAIYPMARQTKEIHVLDFGLKRDVHCDVRKTYLMRRKTYIREEVNITAPLSRLLVDRVSFTYNLKRDLLASIVVDTTILRKVLLNIMSDNELKREILESDTQYVSKENLEYYTNLLKEQLDTFIDKKIDDALKKHNLI